MEKINLKRLAAELNLSSSTISRALNDSYEVSQITKQKVFELATKLNYQPNPHARSLRKNGSKTVAIIIPEVENNFFALAINGIEEIAQQNGFHVLIYITHENASKEVAFARHLLNGRVDGVIITLSQGTSDISHVNDLLENNIPVVFFDRICEDANTVKVTTNDYESGYMATEHLIKRGCKKIAYLGYINTLSISVNRFNGYLAALQDYSIEKNELYILNCSSSHKESYSRVKNLLNSNDRPEAIFASVEQLALTCYEACADLNLKIPEDVKIISFSNLKTAAFLNPSLTTITQPAYNIGKEAAKELFKVLCKEGSHLENKKIVLSSSLIERRSTE